MSGGRLILSRTISGSNTGLGLPNKIDLDANGDIYVANQLGGNVLEFAGGNTSGNVTPLAVIGGSATGLAAPTGLPVAPPLWVRTRKLPAGRVGHRYRLQLRANLGTTPYRWNLAKGKLPSGLRLSRSGVLSGKPRKPGVYRLTVRVVDHSRPHMMATRKLTLIIRPR